MILDDGGDATMLVLRGAQFEKAGVVPPARRTTPPNTRSSSTCSGSPWRPSRQVDPRIADSIKGVTEETTTGVLRLYQFAAAGELASRRSTSTTRSPRASSTTNMGRRHSLVDGINRGTDVLIGGKAALVCGYGDVGKGLRRGAQAQGARSRSPDRPHQRPAGDDGRFRGQDRRGGHRVGRHRHHRHRKQGHHHPRPHAVDEGQGDPGNIGHFDNGSRWPDWSATRTSTASTSSRRSTNSSSPTVTRSSCSPRDAC